MDIKWKTIDFTSHTKNCDTVSCPSGWLISWSEDWEMKEPFAQAYRCHTYDFVSNSEMYGDVKGNYWNYNYPEYTTIYHEPDEISLRNQIKDITSF